MTKKACLHCGMPHDPRVHTEKYIKDAGFPTHDRNYKTAHEEATKAEKKSFPRKDYDKLKKMDQTIGRNELIGKNTKSGQIEISKKVPNKLRKEVEFHEKTENKILLKDKKK